MQMARRALPSAWGSTEGLAHARPRSTSIPSTLILVPKSCTNKQDQGCLEKWRMPGPDLPAVAPETFWRSLGAGVVAQTSGDLAPCTPTS